MTPPSFDGWDLENVLAELSANHLRLIQHTLKGIPLDAFAQRALSRYASDRYARGIPLDDAVDLLIDRLFDISMTADEQQVIEEAKARFKLRDGLGYRHVFKFVSKLGYETKQSLKRKLARAQNQGFLLVSPVGRGFATASWEDRESSYEADILLSCVNNDVDPEFDLKFIYDKIRSYGNGEKLFRALQSRFIYLDPKYEIELDTGEKFNILKDINQDAPNTKLPPSRGFV